jgi:hypothetical protein
MNWVSLAAGVVDLKGDVAAGHRAVGSADDHILGVHHLDKHVLARVLLQS